MTVASDLRERLAFEVREDLSADSPPGDGYGNTEGDWVEQFSSYARVRPLKGGEDVLASRLSGVQPVIITVRLSTRSLRITTGWRARNARNDVEYNIRAIANMDEKRAFLDILAEIGVAV